ncbi:hypothetical protein ABC855_g775 [[Candida] zeylanoides]
MLSRTIIALATAVGFVNAACNPLTSGSCPADPALAASFKEDFTSESKHFSVVNPKGVSFTDDGLELTIAERFDNPSLKSNFYIMFGKVEVVLQAAPGQGIISSFYLQSDDLDEIDIELFGTDTTQFQSNFFAKGYTGNYDRGQYIATSSSPVSNFHTYTLEWTESSLTWSLDGNVVRTLESTDAKGFPQSPMYIMMGSWAGGDPTNPPGTIEWAGGVTDYSKAPFSMYIKSVIVADYSTGSEYSYGDNTGSWQSIQAKDGAVNGRQEQADKEFAALQGGQIISSAKPQSSTTGSATSSSSTRTEAIESSKREEYLPVNIPEQYNYTYLTYHDAVAKLSTGYEDPKEALEHIQQVILKLRTPYSVKHSNQQSSIHTALAGINPKVSHSTFWISGRADPVDNIFLKMIRSRKGVLADALTMIAADIKWRDEFKPTELLLHGDANWFFNNPNSGIIRNFSGRKCWIRGADLAGNSLFLFKVNRHYASDATPQEMKDWCILHIEWARLMMREISTGNDCAAVFFDMTGFSLKNIDYFTVKFIAETLEAHYPECLAYIMIYNAPWIFQTCWNVIKGWLDPVVASKVKFVKSKSEVATFIDLGSLPKCMGGENEYDGEFTEPRPEDINPPKPRDKRYYELIYERHRYHLTYLERTKRWIESTDPSVSAMYLQDKIDLSIKMAQNYIEIDPYIRRKGWYDRNGMLKLAL